jgi:hypothetical protein
MGLIGLAVVLWTFSRLDWAGQRGVGVSQKKRHWDESAQSPPRARPLGEGDRHGMRGAGNGLGVRQIDDQVRVGLSWRPPGLGYRTGFGFWRSFLGTGFAIGDESSVTQERPTHSYLPEIARLWRSSRR